MYNGITEIVYCNVGVVISNCLFHEINVGVQSTYNTIHYRLFSEVGL
jgi:hypothetical protein